MAEPRLLLVPAMVARAKASYARDGDMEAAIRAAFHDVPLSNFAIGTLLDPFDLVVCMGPGGGVGVFARTPGDIDGFDSLPHRANLTFGTESKLTGLAISSIAWPVSQEVERDG